MFGCVFSEKPGLLNKNLIKLPVYIFSVLFI
jgi:hypothetical protein